MLSDYLLDAQYEDVQTHKVQPRVTKDDMTKFFKSVLVEEFPNPAMDLPEAAIDHFQCRDNINLVSRIYTAAINYLNSTYNQKVIRG